MIHFKDNKNKSPLNTRWAQMTKQEQIIERKKMEIQAKLESQKQAAALAAQAKLANPNSNDDNSANIFSNDGSFMNHFKALLEKQKQENAAKILKEQKKPEDEGKKNEKSQEQEDDGEHREERRRPNDRGSRDNRRRWHDRGHTRQHSPMTPVVDDRKQALESNIQSLMQINPNEDGSDSENNDWAQEQSNSNPPPENDHVQKLPFRNMGPLPPGPLPPGSNMPQCPLPPGSWDMMGPGPNMGPRPGMGPGPMMGPGGPNMPPMPPGGPMSMGGPMPPGAMPPGGPMPPFMGGPPNFPMPPNWGPNGPRGPCGPMPPNMMGPNGPMPPFFPPFNPSMMGMGGPPGPPMGGPPGPPMGGPPGPPMGGPPGPPMGGPPGPPMGGPSGPSMGGPPGPPMGGPPGPPMGGPPGPPPPPPGPPSMPPSNSSMMGQNMPPNSMSGPNGPPGVPGSMMGPNGPPNSMSGPNGSPGAMMRPNGPPNSMSGPNGPPSAMMRPNGLPNSMPGPNRPPGAMMRPNGPSNSMSGPNGPPGAMMRPNGPSNSMSGPNGLPGAMMGPNGPPNSMMPPGTMSMGGPMGNMQYMGPRPPFGSNPNFNGPNMPPFMPPNGMVHKMPEPLETIPPPEPMKLQNIPPPMPLPLNHIPKPKDLDIGDIPAPSHSSQDMFPPSVVQAASEVATNGDRWENVLKAIHTQDQNMWFLHNPNGPEYKAFRRLVERIRIERENQNSVKDEDKYEPEFCMDDDDSNEAKPHFKEGGSNSNNESYYWHQYNAKREAGSSQSDEDSVDNRRERRKRKKKSRWGDEPPMDLKPPGVVPPLLPSGTLLPAKLAKIDEDGLKLTNVNRNNQALMQYAMTNYGSTNLEPEDWKKCEDNFKLNLLYQDMLKKRNEVERLAAAGKHKYEYDSDEDTSAGTWEHKLRSREMNATEKWADELTKQAAGKHHIGDFLPPEELRKFMEKYSAVKSGKEPDLSDYKEFKLKEDNLGFKMLQKFGWSEGQGLGADGSGIVDPINKANQPVANLGLGAKTSDIVSSEDDEFDAYRKRMMLAYRFRPNPLNNPRRPYY